MSAASLRVLEQQLMKEERRVLKLKATRPARELSQTRQELITIYRELVQSGDLVLIIRAEKMIMEGDQLRYSNSPAMNNSLKAGIAELNAVLAHVDLVTDFAKYRLVDCAHSLPKRRDERGRPLDEAREALNSHITRLSNLDRSRLDEDEKAFVELRKGAIRRARDLYIELQEKALGEVGFRVPTPALS